GFGCPRADTPEPSGHEAHSAQSKASLASSMAAGGAGANEPAAHVAPPTKASHAPGSHGDMPDGHTPAGHGDGAGGGAPAGYAAFTLGSERARAVGLRVAPVEERDFSKILRTTGVVVLDETRTSHVHAKVRGTIESVSVDFVGKQVAAGAPLCTIYSQEVLAAELEFLSIVNQTSTSAAPGPLADAEKGARDQLVAAARQRLALWDVPASEVARLESTRQARRTFTLDAPRSGIVVAKQALPGMFID